MMSDERSNATPAPARDEPRAVQTLLTPWQRGWLVASLSGASLLLANTLYLLSNRVAAQLPADLAGRFVEGTQTISRWFQVMVLSHTGLGFVVVGMLAVFAVWHLPHVWRRHRRRTVVTGLVFVTSGLVLAITGPFIMYAAASREHTWVWWTHAAAGAIVPIAYVIHRSVSFVRPRAGAYARFGTLLSLAFAAVIVGHAMTHRGADLTDAARLAKSKGTYDGPGAKARDLGDYVSGPYVPPGFVPEASPFFPSAATTTTGDYLPSRIITRGDVSSPLRLAPDLDKFGFVVGEKIGADTCERCHPDTVEQWSKSAHRFASFNNPFYEATVNDMRKNAVAMTEGVRSHTGAFPQWDGRTGEIKSKWCSGCHDPALMLAGKMTDRIDRRLPLAQAGLTCLACHAIDQIHNNTGNGGYNIADEQEDPYLFADAGGGTLPALLHDTAIKAKPEVHKRQMLQPFFRTSEYCAACHKVSLPKAVNDYRWLRAQDEYDHWHDSGVSLNASRTFYLPSVRRVCQDCHMPPEPAPLGDVAAKNGMIRSHRFLAINTALPFVRGDEDTVKRIEAFLRDEKLRIDVFAGTRAAGDGREETVYALDEAQPTLRPGETVTVDVVVRNVGVGHTFPGGTNDSNEGWIEFTLLNDTGQVLDESGFVGDDGYVDPAAHYFRSVIVDRHGQAIRKRNAPDIYAAVYTNVIAPGTAHVVHYRFTVPDAPGRRLTLRARLMWRKFDRAYTEFAFNNNREGFKRFSECPDLPITEICRSEVSLPISPDANSVATTDAPNFADDGPSEKDWMRFNDYGIGLLLQGDTQGGERAFAKVARLAPKRIDGPRNLARVALSDGNLEEAYKQLLRCEELISNDPQTAWFWGVLLQEDGRYVEAESAYRRVLQKFPDDRAAWRNLGRTFYLDDKFERAIEAMTQVLRIDPEDRAAHYHIMLAARALDDDDRAATAEAAYLRYKVDESAAEVTRAYRLAHPSDNLETQAVHVHELTGAAGRGVTRASDGTLRRGTD